MFLNSHTRHNRLETTYILRTELWFRGSKHLFKTTRTQSCKENSRVNLLYAEIKVLSWAKNGHVTFSSQ